MPIPTPFHSRTAALSVSHEWRDWSGYLSVARYAATHDAEYYAVRSGAGLLDVSPLFKYEITGPDAARLVDRIMTRDIAKCAVGQVMYSPWCDEDGQTIDDGTIQRFGPQHFRITAADPSLRWFQDVGYGLNAQIRDLSADLGALALQGPKSREILKQIVTQSDDSLDALKYYYLTPAKIDRIPVTITRTGYTGDLGYEIWVERRYAEKVYDSLYDTGRKYGLMPLGLVALDMLRIEAGLLLIDVDYIAATKADIESQKSTPYEIGLSWAVDLDGADFIGKPALQRELKHGSEWFFCGLEIDWPHLESLFATHNLPPKVLGMASRAAVPVYKDGYQVGQATSITFSPLLKKYIALATLKTQYAAFGDDVHLETTVEFSRQQARACVVKSSFFNPKRKREVLA
ncbi:MAG: aminomethyl transferase family protein [Anaerolineae bacterium]|nr:MAG: aminomethyl transferase family protein [Anaerolineae bacterium]